MSKLIQLKVSEDKLKKYNEIVELLGYKGTYGEYQRAIDFSIDLTLSALKTNAQVLPALDSDKLELYTATITKIRKGLNRLALAKEIAQSNEKVLL